MADKDKRRKKRAKRKKLNQNKRSHTYFGKKLEAGLESRDIVTQGTFNILKKLFGGKNNKAEEKKEKDYLKTIDALRKGMANMQSSFRTNLAASNRAQGQRIKEMADASMARERILIDNADSSNKRISTLTDHVKELAARARSNYIDTKRKEQEAQGGGQPSEENSYLPVVPNNGTISEADNKKIAQEDVVVDVIKSTNDPSVVNSVNAYFDDPDMAAKIASGDFYLNPVTGELIDLTGYSPANVANPAPQPSSEQSFIDNALNPSWADRQINVPGGGNSPAKVAVQPLKWSFSDSKIVSGIVREVNSKYNTFEFGARLEDYVNKKHTAYPIKKRVKEAYAVNKGSGNNGAFSIGDINFLSPSTIDIVSQAEANKAINFDIGSVIPVGDYTFTVNNLYGLRTGKNKVVIDGKAMPKTEHSGGIDIGVKDAAGNRVDLPIIIADGTIVDIHRDSSTTDKDGGYMVTVQLKEDPTKVVRYMHLSGDVEKAKKELLGKDVTRGQVLADKQGYTGSGSGAHIKITMNDYDSDSGIIVNNHRNSVNDPTGLVLTGNI